MITAQQANLSHPLSLAALANPAAAFSPAIVDNPANLAAPNPQDLVTKPSYQMESQTEAVYGQFSYKFNDQWKVTGNLRYSADQKWGNEEDRDVAFVGSSLAALYNVLIPLYGAATPSYDLTGAAVCPSGVQAHCFTGPLGKGVKSIGVFHANGDAFRSLSGTDSTVTGGAGIEWTPNADTFLYARYGRGYAPLAFNSGFISAAPEVGPEFINSYEVGYKQSFGHQLSVDVAAFYYDYDQIQLPITVNVNGILEGQFINFPKAESTGIEFEGVWSPTRDLIFTLSYSFDYTSLLTGCSGSVVLGTFVPTASSVCVTNTDDPLATGPGREGVFEAVAPGLQSVKGSPLPNAPRNKIAVTGAYTWRFDPGNLTAAVTYVWRDTQLGNTACSRTPYNTAPSWSDVDLRATWSGDHDRYEVIGYIRNVFNDLQYTTGGGGTGQIGNATAGFTNRHGLYVRRLPRHYLNPPRTFGVELRYKFF